MKFKVFFAWYDGWIGYFYDRRKRILYIGFPPTIMWSFASDRNYWDPIQKCWISKPLCAPNPDCNTCETNVDCGGNR